MMGVLQEPTYDSFNVANDCRSLHESADGLVKQRVLGRSDQVHVVGPVVEDSLHELEQRRALPAGVEIAGVDIEGHVLQEVVEADPLGVRKGGDELGDDFGLQNDLFDEIDEILMVALEEGAEVSHFNEVDLPLLHLSLEAQTVLELAELLHQVDALHVVLPHASRDFSLF